ncbi:hypothetical protein ACROYT_G024793 [Oculina patagonica]
MKTAVFLALVGLALAASYEFPFSEDEVLASENTLEETNDDFPYERKETQAFEDDLDGTDYKQSEGREDENNAIQNDVDDFMEEEMNSPFNGLDEVSDPRCQEVAGNKAYGAHCQVGQKVKTLN